MAEEKKHKISIEIEVTDEMLRAGNFRFSPHEPARLMELEEMVTFHLKPALQARLQSLSDSMRWIEGKFWEHPSLRREEGRSRRTVTDEEGKEHSVMLSSGYMWPIRVDGPCEGTWSCSDSPTEKCWYSSRTDRAWDFCVFCGDPHERK